jgi:hypothetical protein
LGIAGASPSGGFEAPKARSTVVLLGMSQSWAKEMANTAASDDEVEWEERDAVGAKRIDLDGHDSADE